MKQKVIMALAAFTICLVSAMGNPNNKKECLSPNEFQQRYQNYISQQAKLTAEEAAAFFPIYNECQEKKNQLNSQIWKLRKEARGKELSEKEYQRMLEEIAQLRIQIDELDKSYLPRYHKVLSYKKIFDVQGAELRFHREMLKEMNHPKGKKRTEHKK